MIEKYTDAIRQALNGVLELLIQLALPLAIGLGLLGVVALVTVLLQRSAARNSDAVGEAWWVGFSWQRYAAERLGYISVALFLVVGWAALRTTRPLAQQDIRWRESAEATSNPAPDAPPVAQAGPALARLSERVYARTLTLPSNFLRRIGAEGVNVLAPYLTDPTAENVLRLRDNFQRRGRDVVFTREATLLNEEPVPFTNSQIKVKFRRLAGRAYEAAFEGHYTFANAEKKPSTLHFLFTPPEAGTVSDLSVTVGNTAVTEPSAATPDSNTYEWKSEMKPGEKQEAIVRYTVVGARTWSYDLGSQRRRVEQFSLEAETPGAIGYLRGSLQPTDESGNRLRWQMSDVVTAQQIALFFAPSLENQLYLQALSALPASFVLFLIGVVAVGLWVRPAPGAAGMLRPGHLLAALILFAFGLGSATVLAIYFGPVAGIICGPLLGAALASLVLGRYSLLATIPAATIPATFLSAANSGMLIFMITLFTLLAICFTLRSLTAMKPHISSS